MRRRRIMSLLLLLIVFPSLYLATRGVVSAQTSELVWPPDGWNVNTLNPTLRWRSQGYTQLRIYKAQSPTLYLVDTVLPSGQDSYTVPLSQALEAGTLYKWKVRSNPLPPASSPLTWGIWSLERGFTTPGSASWGSSAQAGSLWPTGGTVTSSITPTLSWTLPPGGAQFELVITPEGNEAARTSIIRPIASSFTIPGPPTWYGMLPDTLYYWRVRVTQASYPVGPSEPSWGPWSPLGSFRTPAAAGSAITPITPDGQGVASTTPTLSWQSADPNLFFFEVQASADPRFMTDPSKSIAPVYWELRHGGVTSPPNSYTIPATYPLAKGTTYYWRVRPIGSKMGASVPWSKTWSFTTPVN